MDAARLEQLRWRCRRGMRELDLLLRGHLERHASSMDATATFDFERLLACQDIDLYHWLTGRERVPDPTLAALVARIRATPPRPDAAPR